MGKIIGIMGQARAGKDSIAAYLAENYNAVRLGLADPMKRFCKEVFDFSDEQLYGDQRDVFDIRYKRLSKTKAGLPVSATNLTARYALQTLGTEWGRNCYENVWIDYGIRVAQELLRDPYRRYTVEQGLYLGASPRPTAGVVFSDLRFRNEFEAVKKAGGFLVRVYRPGADGETAGVSKHASEEEQKTIKDEEFDLILRNNDTLSHLHMLVREELAPRVGLLP